MASPSSESVLLLAAGPSLLGPSLLDMIEAAFAGGGFTLHVAATLDSGLERWKAGGVAAVLLDGSAAGAPAAVQAFARLVPEPPVIAVMPGNGETESVSSALFDAGAQDMVPPEDAVGLRRAVRNAIGRQRRENAGRAQSRAVAQLLDTTNDAVRGPVGRMIAMARLTLDDPLLPRQRERMEALRAAGLGLMAVLDDLRDLAQLESGGMAQGMAEFDLPALIGAVDTRTAAQSDGKATALTATIGPDVPTRLMPAAPAPLSVLLVEDNAIGRLVAGGFLKSLGHGVTLAEDGAAGVALATARLFDLIVMDVQMPVMDGHEATRAIRRLPGAAGRVPIVALTAASDDGDDAACRAAGMDDCLHKPLSMDALRAAIGRLVGSGSGA